MIRVGSLIYIMWGRSLCSDVVFDRVLTFRFGINQTGIHYAKDAEGLLGITREALVNKNVRRVWEVKA